MSTDCRIFVLSNALMKVLGCEPDIICIAQIAWETINNALPIYNWRLDFFGFMISPQFSAHKNSNVGKILWLRSRNCFRTALVATWSLNGKLIPCCATIIGVSYRYAAETFLKRKLLIPLSKPSIVNRQCVVYSFCAMQIMSGTQPDTFINALLSTNIRQSVDIPWKLTVATTSWKKTNLEF